MPNERISLATAALLMVSGWVLLLTGPTFAGGIDDNEFQYVFAGMLQERSKIKSYLCTINGMDKANGPFEATILLSGDNIRFTKKSRPVVSMPEETLTGLATKDIIALWDKKGNVASTRKATPSELQLLNLWDPLTAGLLLDGKDHGYKESLERRYNLWRKSHKVSREGNLFTITFIHPNGERDMLISITVDSDHGFTPVRYKGESVYKNPAKGKNKDYFEVTAKWDLKDGVWVPVRHEVIELSHKIAVYDIAWENINQPVKDDEFTMSALSVSNQARKIEMQNGKWVVTDDPTHGIASERFTMGWVRKLIYVIGFTLIGIWIIKRLGLHARKA